MEFELNRTQQDIQKAVRDFTKGEFDKDLAMELEEAHEFPTKIWQKAGDLGLLGVHFPEEYSGQGLGCLEDILVIEELCRGDSTIGSAVALSVFASELILHNGSEAQKQAWLPKVAEAQVLSAGAFTEPDHGSDITRMNTTAVKDGDEWVINGTKTFITNGGMAAYYCVLCQTDADHPQPPRHECHPGGGRPGRGDHCRCGPQDGHPHDGHDRGEFQGRAGAAGKPHRRGRPGVLPRAAFFDESRIQIAAQALGTAQGAYDRALAYVKKREQFGKKIAQFQVTQHKLADMATSIELARLITYKAAWNFDQGRIDPKLTSMAKMFAAKTAVEVCDEAIQLHGGYGYIAEYEVERFYRDAKICELYEGTKEIQKNTIASALIGKLK
jgi:alkylation response protein AidB-like acyl-CoA dehydrogenase